MARITVDNLLDWINNEDWDHIEMAGGYDMVLKILEKRNALHRLDFESDSISNDLNIILYKLVTSDNKEVVKETYRRIKEEILNSPTLVNKDNKWYMVLDDMSELSMFFCKGGRHDDQSIVENVLGQGDWEPYDNTVNDLYDDVISELNPNNLSYLKEEVKKNLIGETISTDTDLLLEICGDDCGGEILVSEENFDKIFTDEQTLMFILKKYLSDIRSELYNLHWNAYNGAYRDEVYENIWSELEEYINKEGSDWVGTPSRKDPTKTKFEYYADVTNSIDHLIFMFLDSNKGYGGPHRISYFGSLESIINNMIYDGTLGCMHFRDPEYPDHRKVREYLNDDFDL